MRAENLAGLLDAMTQTSIYVIEEGSHQLLYFNRRCCDTGRGKAALGVKCHEVWPEVCANCPLDALGDNPSSHIVCYDPLLKTTVDVTANRILWDDTIPAVVVTATPHKLNFEEEQGLQKIQQMYARSLLTVFGECIIANLTADYYVNCQKDMLWTGIPKEGNFGKENRKYAKKLLHPDDLPLFNDAFSREAMIRLFGEGKRQITRRLRRRTQEGGYHMVEFTAARIDQQEGGALWCVLVFRDVQEEYLLERQRNLELSQLATVAQVAFQMLISVNLTQNTYHMLAYERFPVKKPEDQGSFSDLIASECASVHPDYRDEFINKFSRRALMETFMGGRRIVAMEVPHLGEDGQYHWHFTQVVRVESPYTDELIEITLSRNIDEERRMQWEMLEKERRAKKLLEDALDKAEKANRAKSDFLSKMSHDIRTPLNAITGMTELAQLHIGDAEKMQDYLHKIASSGKHLLSLINEVLDVSKIESGSVELEEREFDLRAVAQGAAEMIRLPVEQKRQTLLIQIDPQMHLQVLGDAARLGQVLVNILENASKYTPEGGKIAFKVEEIKKEELHAGTYRFEIEDEGIGMAPEYLQHIFEPFSRADDSRTSKVPGTGLGMTIVKSLVSMMGGSIDVHSEYGKGSRFTVTLYLNKACAPKAKEPEPVQWPKEAYSQMRVLLVEDNEINRQIAMEMLQLLGVQVEVAENGREAVEAVHNHPPLYYSMVFMDIQMPVLDGYEATRQIRNSGMARIEELPIFAMTADAFAEDVRRARLAGMNGHLAKPISLEQLRGVLSECLSWRREHLTETMD
ncbi:MULTISPECIES: ATP-binding protein [unclassified Clostridium]|uniref:ATP-binding protein n=1 Tax=unclassified Clostridium TaxID=2614128 RepID=UPI001106AD2F|nr:MULTISPECIES: ATP-binding protein [unclassified Clostridium]